MKKYVLMQLNDIKMNKWKEALSRYQVDIVPMIAPAYVPFTILKNLFIKGRPKTVFFRYLNDYPSITMTLIVTLSEIISLIIVSLLRIKVIWICHNVDRESKQYFPRISRFRRNMFARKSSKVLVMDRLLIKHAESIFPYASEKIDFLTFGEALQNNYSSDSVSLLKEIKAFVESERKKLKNKKVLIASCIGNPNEKNLSYEKLIDLLDKAEDNDFYIRVILIGPIGNYLNNYNADILNEIQKDERIFFVNKKISVDEYEISKYIDFYWRVYNDYSVPFTIYHAAALEKPVLTQNIGFLAELVNEYKLGEVINSDWDNLSTKLSLIQKSNQYDYKSFLESHNWEKSSEKLYKYI